MTTTGQPVLQPGERFAGRYRVDKHLGEGGMGAVYLVVDELLGEDVALKIASGRHAGGDSARIDERTIERQRREVSLARRVTHPNVARVFDLGTDGGRLYITMEHVPGASLRQRIRQGPVAVTDVVTIGHQIASALAAAHDAGVVHLDLKPDNVMLVEGPVPRAVLVDFGVSRALGERATGAGTLDAMAPEQLGDGAIGGAADVYALGLLLFELLTGSKPFGMGDDRVLARLTRRPPLLASPVPPELASLVDGCLARQPGDRPGAHTLEREFARRLAHGPELTPTTPRAMVHHEGGGSMTAAVGLRLAHARTALAVAGDELAVLPILDSILVESPDLDVALATRALALVRAWSNAFAGDDIADRAVTAVSLAIAKAPHLADSHFADALIADGSGDIAYAVRAARRALARDPLHAFSHELLGFLEVEGGVADASRLELAFALDGAHLASAVHIAREHFFAGRDTAGEALLDEVDRRRATRESELLRMRWCLWRRDGALARRLLRQLPDDGSPVREGTRLVLGHVIGDVDVDEVRRFLERVLALPSAPKRRAFLHMIFVELLATVDSDAALEHLLGAVQLPLADLRWLDACPALTPLRERPAFHIARATVQLRVDEAFTATALPPAASDTDGTTVMARH